MSNTYVRGEPSCTITVSEKYDIYEARNYANFITILLHKLGLSCKGVPEGTVICCTIDGSMYVKTSSTLVRMASPSVQYSTHQYYYGSSTMYAGSGRGVHPTNIWGQWTDEADDLTDEIKNNVKK